MNAQSFEKLQIWAIADHRKYEVVLQCPGLAVRMAKDNMLLGNFDDRRFKKSIDFLALDAILDIRLDPVFDARAEFCTPVDQRDTCAMPIQIQCSNRC